jgi:hypothetical protein
MHSAPKGLDEPVLRGLALCPLTLQLFNLLIKKNSAGHSGTAQLRLPAAHDFAMEASSTELSTADELSEKDCQF